MSSSRRLRQRSNSYLNAVLEGVHQHGQPNSHEESLNEAGSVRTQSQGDLHAESCAPSSRVSSTQSLAVPPAEDTISIVTTSTLTESAPLIPDGSSSVVPAVSEAATACAAEDPTHRDSSGDPAASIFLNLSYHPLNSVANQEKGFAGNLTDAQQTALQKLKSKMETEGFSVAPYLCPPAETEEHLLLRFLRARQFHVHKAWDMLKADILWRQEIDILKLRDQRMGDVVQCDLGLIQHHLPLWQSGFDKQGRPVIYKRFGRCEISTLKQHTSIESLVRLHVWTTEQQWRVLGRQSQQLQHNIETFLFVVDAAGWSLRLASRDAFSYLKTGWELLFSDRQGIADIDSAHYPERLGAIVIVNAPMALDFAWRMVQAKVHIVRRGGEAVLQTLIALDQIPSDYGGTAPALPDRPPETE